ncbi:expressed unknown protein [Seminavis robusta]|uniref:Uncharacterized protein n=1 Tax=Seminavis robusta TaxID=568900 RepID=A0A9N8E7D5_9STRA|nr:expressed unknown protein [Seminavis robusta]|eukprot:Sro700_g189570.1 n/a (390) ;mRNA; f:3281-4450
MEVGNSDTQRRNDQTNNEGGAIGVVKKEGLCSDFSARSSPDDPPVRNVATTINMNGDAPITKKRHEGASQKDPSIINGLELPAEKTMSGDEKWHHDEEEVPSESQNRDHPATNVLGSAHKGSEENDGTKPVLAKTLHQEQLNLPSDASEPSDCSNDSHIAEVGKPTLLADQATNEFNVVANPLAQLDTIPDDDSITSQNDDEESAIPEAHPDSLYHLAHTLGSILDGWNDTKSDKQKATTDMEEAILFVGDEEETEDARCPTSCKEVTAADWIAIVTAILFAMLLGLVYLRPDQDTVVIARNRFQNRGEHGGNTFLRSTAPGPSPSPSATIHGSNSSEKNNTEPALTSTMLKKSSKESNSTRNRRNTLSNDSAARSSWYVLEEDEYKLI